MLEFNSYFKVIQKCNKMVLKIILPLVFLANMFAINSQEKKFDQSIKAENMKHLGLIGGLSWHSTVEYYKYINTAVNTHYGNNTNPPLSVYTLNQAEVHRFQKENKWDSIAYMLADAGKRLKLGGAESVLFCSNTPHKVYDLVEKQLDIPMIHIGDATAKAIQEKGLKKVGFIGTKFTMEGDFITSRIEKKGIETIVPNKSETLNELHRIIHEELTYGKIVPESKKYVLSVIQNMIDNGAEGIILGCTEFPLMIFQEDLNIPVFNTSLIHSKTAADYILNK